VNIEDLVRDEKTSTVCEGKPVYNSGDVSKMLGDMELLDREHFVALFLDTRARVLRRETISIGTLTASIVHPRELFSRAIELRAASIVVAHNHPSGNPDPSDEDVELTTRLVKAGVLIGIPVLDHLVIAREGYRSLVIEGGRLAAGN
jgi:DNA repair protein RadC